jgi:hypothetical protein
MSLPDYGQENIPQRAGVGGLSERLWSHPASVAPDDGAIVTPGREKSNTYNVSGGNEKQDFFEYKARTLDVHLEQD